MSKLKLFFIQVAIVVGVYGFHAGDLLAQSRSFECLPGGALAAPEASKLLKSVQESYNSIRSFRAGFTQHSYLAALDTFESSVGEVWFKKPGKMKWHYQRPEEQLFLTSDETLWLYQPVERQLLIDRFQALFVDDLPVSFLLGVGDLEQQFSLKDVCKGIDGRVLTLLPKQSTESGEVSMDSFKLLIGLSDAFPRGAEIHDIGGNSTAIIFSQIDRQAPIGDELFVPNFPAGIDVTDRRIGAER